MALPGQPPPPTGPARKPPVPRAAFVAARPPPPSAPVSNAAVFTNPQPTGAVDSSAPAPGKGGSPVKRATATFIYVATALAVVVVVVALVRDRDIKIGPESISVAGGAGQVVSTAAEVSPEVIEANENALEDRIDTIEADLAVREATVTNPVQLGFSGRWTNGIWTYDIEEVGVFASIIELTQDGFTTAAGEGEIVFPNFFFSYFHVSGGGGEGVLTMVEDGNRLVGEFTNGFDFVAVDLRRVS